MLDTQRRALTFLIAASCFLVAAAPATRGREKAALQLETAAAEHVRILTDVQSRLPTEARADLSGAIEAATKGLDAARAAVSKTSPVTPPAVTAATPPTTPTTAATATPADAPTAAVPEGATPTVTGLARAREQLAASFETSRLTLQGLIPRVPEQAAAAITEALARIDLNRALALERFDRLVAGERPGKPETLERPARPEMPTRPEQAERVERPARPERPQQPNP